MISCIGRRALVGAISNPAPRVQVARRLHIGAISWRASPSITSIDSASRLLRVSPQQLTRTHRSGVFASAAAVEQVSVEGARQLVDGEGYTYLDVRTPEEFKAGHAVGAVNHPIMLKSGVIMSPNPSFAKQVAEAFPDTGTKLVVACKCGIRSKKACEILAAENYANLKDFSDGFDGWQKTGLPVE